MMNQKFYQKASLTVFLLSATLVNAQDLGLATGGNKILNELRKVGLTIAVDDFGTGYSSLSRLNQINIDTVKIDKSFIDRINYIEEDKLITGDIISLSHKLGLNVIAEGVESKNQEKYLIENKCDLVQGYLYSKPLLNMDALGFLKEDK